MKYLKRQQRRLSRKVKSSNRWPRQKRVVACAHAKLAGMRRDWRCRIAKVRAISYK